MLSRKVNSKTITLFQESNIKKEKERWKNVFQSQKEKKKGFMKSVILVLLSYETGPST